MMAYYSRYCTATHSTTVTCWNCGATNYVDRGIVWYGRISLPTITISKQEGPSVIQVERMRWAAMRALAKPPSPRRPRIAKPVVPGQEWRRIRAHCGMARARA